MAARDLRILYVAKFPPSHSGVARYASRFACVLDRLGIVTTIVSGHESSETASVRRVITVLLAVRRALRDHPDWVIVELSGRSIAELLACVYVLGRGQARLWLTVHDSPEVTGGLFWFTVLDRKGLRRVAAFLSRFAGTPIERWTLERAAEVVCLSAFGATELAAKFALKRPVRMIHPVADVAPPASVRRQMFLPGPVALAATSQVLEAVAGEANSREVVIGWCDASTEALLRDRARVLQIEDRVRFTGSLSQEGLSSVYASSFLVIYWRGNGGRGRVANYAACSYPVIDALASGCVLITNTARGAKEYVAENDFAFDLEAKPGDLRKVVSALSSSCPGVVEVGSAGSAAVGSRFAAVSIAAEVAQFMRSGAGMSTNSSRV